MSEDRVFSEEYVSGNSTKLPLAGTEDVEEEIERDAAEMHPLRKPRRIEIRAKLIDYES